LVGSFAIEDLPKTVLHRERVLVVSAAAMQADASNTRTDRKCIVMKVSRIKHNSRRICCRYPRWH